MKSLFYVLSSSSLEKGNHKMKIQRVQPLQSFFLTVLYSIFFLWKPLDGSLTCSKVFIPCPPAVFPQWKLDLKKGLLLLPPSF